MYNLDPILNGQLSRQDFQDILQQAQHERFVREVEAAQSKHKTLSQLRAILVAILNLIWR